MLRYTPPALLAAGCLLISGAREQKRMPPRQSLAAIHVNAPGYTSRDTVVAADEQRVAGMSHYLMRTYQQSPTDPGFGVYVGYYDYQIQGKTIHSPRNCLPGAGYEQLKSEGSELQSIPVPGGGSVRVNRYLLARKGEQALVYYWYEGRGRVEPNEYKVKWNLLRDAALYGRTEEALVRIVVPIDARGLRPGQKPDYARADSLATAVASQLVPAVAAVVPAPPNA